jgi:hypothetical protein
MKNRGFWAMFYTVIALGLFVCVIYWPYTSTGYKTSQFLILGAVIASGFAIYSIGKALKSR